MRPRWAQRDFLVTFYFWFLSKIPQIEFSSQEPQLQAAYIRYTVSYVSFSVGLHRLPLFWATEYLKSVICALSLDSLLSHLSLKTFFRRSKILLFRFQDPYLKVKTPLHLCLCGKKQIPTANCTNTSWVYLLCTQDLFVSCCLWLTLTLHCWLLV